MGGPARAAEDLAIHLAPAGAVINKARLPRFQRGSGQHRLEHRAHRIALQRPVQHGAVRRVQAGRRVCRVIPRRADARPHFGTGRFQHHNAPCRHHPGRDGFRRPLEIPRKGQLHPHSPAVGVGLLRRFPQLPLRVDKTGQRVALPGAGKGRIESRFQPRRSFAVSIHIPDQMLRQRCRRGTNGHRPARNSKL